MGISYSIIKGHVDDSLSVQIDISAPLDQTGRVTVQALAAECEAAAVDPDHYRSPFRMAILIYGRGHDDVEE